jgi:uncharacterized protein YajQ (UPF0234 family)
MPSFDIVSKTDLAEVDNALRNIAREIGQRFDFKNSKSKIERNDTTLTINADDEFKLKQLHDLLNGHLARRKVDPAALEFKDPEAAAGSTLRQTVNVRQGIEQELAKQIVKNIKGSKLKVQAAIQGDSLRVSGKKRDDLQEAIELVKGMKVGLPLQYENFRD